MKDFWEETEKKKINKKKIIIIVVIFLIIVALAVTAYIYINDEISRDWIDKNIFRKEVLQDNVATIELKEDENPNIYAFNRCIGILNKGVFKIYNNTGKEEKSLTMDISSPLFDSANRFLVVAENKGKKVYLITDKDETWETEIDGEISQVHVNKNGYVAVVIVNTSYKTVIAMYTPQGKEMFKTYLKSTRTADVSISNDNKYLAIAEVDTSGTMIQSNIKIVSIEKSQSDPTNSVVNTYSGENNKLITKIKYQDKDKLICMYTDSINVISEGKDENIFNNNNKKITFTAVELDGNVVAIEEKSSGLFTADSVVNITNIENKNVTQYVANSVTKEIYTCQDTIALNLGAEVEFVNTSGWLLKRYIANQEITNITISNNIAGIIYRDKIEIVNL